jgi:hypothetical protein
MTFNSSSMSFAISTNDHSKIGTYDLIINVLNYDSSLILNSFSFKLIIQGAFVTLNTNTPYFGGSLEDQSIFVDTVLIYKMPSIKCDNPNASLTVKVDLGGGKSFIVFKNNVFIFSPKLSDASVYPITITLTSSGTPELSQ